MSVILINLLIGLINLVMIFPNYQKGNKLAIALHSWASGFSFAIVVIAIVKETM